MLSLKEAQATLIREICRARDVEPVALDRAHGRYLAESVQALADNPAFDNSAMDGYAVNLAQLSAAGSMLPLQGESSAGDAPGTLTADTCMRIFTGAPVPKGADAVVMQENIRREDDSITFPSNIQPGQNIRFRAEDFHFGKTLYERGKRLAAHDLALLSGAGVAHMPVFRQPRVLVVATGDELVSPGQTLGPGQVYESNRLATLRQAQALGADVVDGGIVRDDPDAIRQLLQGVKEYDFVITSGGVSVGDHDHVKKIFAEIGEINFWKVKIKPGKPIAFGRLGEHTHFFGLPGNPLSSLVTFLLFVQPALLAWHYANPDPLVLSATASQDFNRKAGRTEFLRARFYMEDGRLMTTPHQGQGSHMLGTLSDTNGLIRLEQDSKGFASGDTVKVLALAPLFM